MQPARHPSPYLMSLISAQIANNINIHIEDIPAWTQNLTDLGRMVLFYNSCQLYAHLYLALTVEETASQNFFGLVFSYIHCIWGPDLETKTILFLFS